MLALFLGFVRRLPLCRVRALKRAVELGQDFSNGPRPYIAKAKRIERCQKSLQSIPMLLLHCEREFRIKPFIIERIDVSAQRLNFRSFLRSSGPRMWHAF